MKTVAIKTMAMKKSLLACYLLSIPSYSWAAIELTENFTVSGFGSTSWARSDNSTPLIVNRSISDTSCFDCDTTFGLQFDYYRDAFNASLQLVKRPQDHWSDPELEWAYLGYALKDYELRAGRLRLPVFLASEYYYVGQAYVTARPNEEVYNSLLGITGYNGASVTWTGALSDDMQLSVTPYIGLKDNNSVVLNSVMGLEFETKFMWGINLLLNGDNYRVNFAYLDSNFEQTLLVNNQKITTFEDQNIALYSLGGEYVIGSFNLTAEGQYNDLSKSWYIGAAYRYGSFTPYSQFGQKYSRGSNNSVYQGKTGDSWLLGLRYDVLYNVSVNAEWQTFTAYGGQSGPFIQAPLDSNADMFSIMVNFTF